MSVDKSLLPSTTDWRAVWVVVAAGVVSALHLGKVAIAGPQLQAELRLSLGMLGGLGATFAVLGALGGVMAGSVVARAGDRRMLVAGLWATVLGAALALSTDRFPVLLASRAVEGLGFLLITVAGPTVLGRLVRAADRNGAMALWSCFMPAGMALAMLTGPWLGEWRKLWAAAAVAAGLLAVVVLCAVPRAPAPAEGLLPPVRIADVWRPAPLALAATFLLYSLMFFALFSFLPVLLQQRMQVGAGAVGLLAALASAVNMVGNLAAGVLLKKMTREALGTAAAVTMGLCAVGIFLPVLGPEAAFVLCLVFSAVGGLIPASLLSSVAQVTSTPTLAALVVGLLMQGSNLGQALGPVLVGNAVDRHGWPAAAAWVVATALVMVWTVRWRPGRKAIR
ncbi:MAG: MFS transporter [Gammaproteobacteria bacterium]|nr:MFS transporter [Gammaproteobacteria bacterium]MBU1508595.1 MFS transporter [Gammaproteobacteria bacterium]MBU2119644.1 MFS transporter [Gammaproteobacteria bacterium]MBU2169074.1 MFS transporter [Gammaproteobacteria bacterium]MBU2202239.1 MFS transporter [Gammaproteobacteria bacterium]